jgi:hypothetical protein
MFPPKQKSFRGEFIDTGFDPSRELVYNLLVSYFENPLMTKIKDVAQYSMYLTKIQAMLGIEFRYLIVFVLKNKEAVNSTSRLDNLKWISLQTRTLTDDHNISQHSYIPRRIPELDQRIVLENKSERQYLYKVEKLPILITLLPKTKSIDYNSTGTVTTALETYQTIVNFL